MIGFDWMSVFLLALSSLLLSVRADEFDDAILSYMNAQYIRGAGVAYYNGSDPNKGIEFARGYGKVSSSSSAGDVTADTAFMLASVGKVFAASAVAVMLDRGLITSLDEDICETTSMAWASTNACRHPDFPNTIVTWRMLVTHRSSLIDDIPLYKVGGVEYDASYGPASYEGSYGNPTCPLDDAQGFYRALFTNNKSLTSVGGGSIDWYAEAAGGWQSGIKPGSKYSYSNFAFGYIAALVELKTGKTFEQFSQENLFQPLGMTRTSWFRESLLAGTVAAVPVYDDGNDYQDVGHYCFIDFTSGQLYTTANDMAKFLKSMLDRGVNDLWSNAVGDLLFSCQERSPSGEVVQDCTTGVGWILIDNSYKQSLPSDFQWLGNFKDLDWSGGAAHDGSEDGIASQILVLPASRIYVAVMTNTDEAAAEEIAKKVLTVASGKSAAPTPAACFSGETVISVKGKGDMNMKNLRIGDAVAQVNGGYSEVYSFGHRHETETKNYLKIQSDNRNPLEISAEHLIYVQVEGGKKLISAGQLRVGDSLVTSSGLPSVISAIKTIRRKGAYSPLTVSGQLIVSGAEASSYVTRDWIPKVVSGKALFYLQHAGTAPVRVYCQYIGGCEHESYDENTGFSSWVQFWFSLEQWLPLRIAVSILLGLISTPVISLFVTTAALAGCLFSRLPYQFAVCRCYDAHKTA